MREALMRGALLGALLGAVALALVLGLVFLSTGEPGIGYGKLILGLTVLCLGAGTPAGALLGGLQYNRAMMEPEKAAPPIIDEYEDDGWDADIEGTGEWLPPSKPDLAERIAECAKTQAVWHYEHGRDPTRDAFKEAGVSQPEWNSGRHLLKIMGLVGGSGRSVKWQEVHKSVVEGALNRIVADQDRIWVPCVGNGHGLNCVLVSETLENNRHTQFVPTYTAPLHGDM